MNTWIIEPNWLVCTLLTIASFSLGAIAVRMWNTPKNEIKCDASLSSKNKYIGVGNFYKTTIFTLWLSFSAWLMWKVYNNPILSKGDDFWSSMIAVVAIIVATLIGWQIYSAMDWNSKADKLNRIGSLENKLNKAYERLIEQDERNLLLIRAVNEIRKVTTHSNASMKYLCAAKAISLLLDANVPIEDDLIDVQVDGLSLLLEDMEKSNDAQAKRLFASSLDSVDRYYHQIIASINRREDDISDFRNKITSIRDRRKTFVENNS